MRRLFSLVSTGGIDGFLILFMLLGGMVFFGLMVAIHVHGLWHIFKKARRAPWLSLIPLVNRVTLCGISGVGLFGFALYLAAWAFVFLGLYNALEGLGTNILLGALVLFVLVHIWQGIALARRFGSGVLFGIGLALLPAPFCFILGDDETRYLKRRRSANPTPRSRQG